MKKILILLSMMVLFSVSVSAMNVSTVLEALPFVGQSSWGNPILIGINNTLDLIQVAHTDEGKLQANQNVSFNTVNVTNNLIVLGNVSAELPDSFKNLNFTTLYDLEATTRWLSSNFTSAYDSRTDRWQLSNFTNSYDSRNDRFSILNGTLLPFSLFTNENVSDAEENPSNATISIPEAQITDLVHITNATITITESQVSDLFHVTNATLEITESQVSDLVHVTNSTISITESQISDLLHVTNNTIEITESQVSDLVHIGNATIFLPSQEKIDGLKAADSPKFTAVNVTDVRILTGSGDPESSVTAPTGSIYLRTNGTLYVKEVGTGNTGWTGK